MADIPDAEAAGEQVAAVVENVVAQAEAVAETAEARAAAADALNDTLTEAALRDKIVQRVDDMQEDVDTWHNALEETRAELTATRQEVTSLTAQLAEALTRMPPLVVVTEPNPPPSSLTLPPSDPMAEAPPALDPTKAPLSSEGADARPAAPAKRKFRLT